MTAPEPAEARSARLFVALPVPVRVRDALAGVQAELRERAGELRFTRPQGWHVTLAFLGDVDRQRIDEVGTVVGAALTNCGPVQLTLGGAGRFGRHVLWVGVEDDPPGAVAAMGERVQVAIEDAGLPVRRQPVDPHLTLARGGRGRPVRDRYLDDLDALLADAGGPVHGDTGTDATTVARAATWTCDEVQVWRSELGQGPARYHVLASTPLRG